MREQVRSAAEGLARKTTRRGLFGRSADIAFGALIGAAAGTVTRTSGATAGGGTVCAFPYGTPCPCDGCQSSGVCAKPCVINTTWYSSGCWVSGSVTCCDCDCETIGGAAACGCGSDYHTNPSNCPNA